MVVRQSLIYGVGRILAGISNFALLSYLTFVMTKADYGIYTVTMAASILAFTLTIVWITVSLNRFMQMFEDQSHVLGNMLMIFLSVVGFAGLIALVTVALLPEEVPMRLREADCATAASCDPVVIFVDVRPLIILGYLCYLAMSWLEMCLKVLTARLEAKRSVTYSMFRTISSAGLAALLIVLGFGVEGLLIGFFLGSAIPGVILWWQLWRKVPFKLDKALLGQILKFGLPMGLANGMAMLSFTLDRFMITYLRGVDAVGPYSAGFEMSNKAIQTTTDPIGVATLPLVIKTLEKDGEDAARWQLRRNLELLLLIAVPSALGLASVAKDFSSVLIGPEFRDLASQVIPVIAIVSFILAMNRHYLDHAFHLGVKSNGRLYIASTEVVCNVIFNIWFILKFGPIGAAYATLIAAMTGAFVSVFIGRRAFKLPWPIRRVAPIFLAGLTMVAAIMLVPGEPGLVTLIAKMVVGGTVYGAIVFGFNVLDLRDHIMKIANKKLKRT